MKHKLLILALLITGIAQAQFPTIPGYTKISSRYNWLAGTFDQFTLPGRGSADTTLRTGQWRASGAVIVDTVNHVVYFYSGGAWRAVGADAGLVGGNLGSGYPLYVPASKGVKTVAGGSGVQLDSSTSNQITFKMGGLANAPATAFTEARELNLGTYGLALRRNYPGATLDSRIFSYFSLDTVTSTTFDSPPVDASMFYRLMRFQVPFKDYTGGFNFTVSPQTTDSTRVHTRGGDFGYATKSAIIITRPDDITARRTVLNTTEASTPIDAMPAHLSWTNLNRPSTSTGIPIRARGWYAGNTSYVLIQNYGDTLDNYVGFVTNSLLNTNARIKKFYDFYGFGSGYAPPRIDSAWSFYAPYATSRNYLRGPLALGGVNTGPTDQLELFGNFKWFDPAINTAGTALMVVWDSVSKRLGRAPVPSGGGSTPTYEQVLTAGNSLSATSGIDYNTNEFVHSDIGNYIIENAGARKRLNISLAETRLAGYSTDRYFRATDDSLYLAGVNFSADTTTYKPTWKNPVTGALVYGYHASGAVGSGWALTGNAATAGASAGDWIGTNNNVSFRIRSNNTERIVLDSTGDFRLTSPSNKALHIKQGAQSQATSGAYYNGLVLENSASTASYRWGYGSGGLLSLSYFNGTSTYANLLYINSSGKMGINAVSPTAYLHLPAGSTAATTAPLKFTSGSLMTTAEAGGVEFLTDKYYGTITTGAARKEFTMNDAALTPGTTPVATTNGRLTDGLILASGTYTPTASAASGITVGTIEPFTYSRTGSTVTVSGYVATSGATAGTPASFELTLPVASNMTTVYQCTGTVGSVVAGSDGYVLGEATNNTAVIQWVGGATAGSQGLRVMFQYQVL